MDEFDTGQGARPQFIEQVFRQEPITRGERECAEHERAGFVQEPITRGERATAGKDVTPQCTAAVARPRQLR
jgi:hypothetical protein